MSAASLALSAGGVAFRVPKGMAVADPLKLDFTGPGHVRALLVLEEGASLTLLESRRSCRLPQCRIRNRARRRRKPGPCAHVARCR